jgi:hypothetical protein
MISGGQKDFSYPPHLHPCLQLPTGWISQSQIFLILFLLQFFIRTYSLHRGGFTVTILIRFILYIIYIVPIVFPPQAPPHPT